MKEGLEPVFKGILRRVLIVSSSSVQSGLISCELVKCAGLVNPYSMSLILKGTKKMFNPVAGLVIGSYFCALFTPICWYVEFDENGPMRQLTASLSGTSVVGSCFKKATTARPVLASRLLISVPALGEGTCEIFWVITAMLFSMRSSTSSIIRRTAPRSSEDVSLSGYGVVDVVPEVLRDGVVYWWGRLASRAIYWVDRDEIVNSYEAIYGSRTIRSVGIIPPFEAANVDTDEDSDFSDDEVVGDVSHLPGRILRATASVVHEESEDETENNEIEGIVGSVTETVPSSSKLTMEPTFRGTRGIFIVAVYAIVVLIHYIKMNNSKIQNFEVNSEVNLQYKYSYTLNISKVKYDIVPSQYKQ
ncbi:hypothetical protein C0J52_19314 [Blattella germanica]|nr:hypothetical protein C0J52_19314 [Blattella germanica]